MTLGDIIKEYRSSHGISMERFAERAGLSKGYISMLEKNINPRNGLPFTPSLETYRSVARAIGIDVNDLIKSVDNDQPVALMNFDILPYVHGRRIPIIGAIPAGAPVLAGENIEGYDYADVPDGDDYFFLRVKGDSMINAGINSGDLILVRQQTCADNGNIVVALINGDEATLKRFHQQGDMIVLQPENTGLI